MQWRLLKLFPQHFGAMRSEDELTESQRIWLQCQLLLDDGADACRQCGAVDLGTYCRQCGACREEAQHACSQCRLQGPGPYCVHCGAVLVDSVEEALKRGAFDWEQWHKDLAPFLGGLTTKERDVLAKE
jgi:hypothetical protein